MGRSLIERGDQAPPSGACLGFDRGDEARRISRFSASVRFSFALRGGCNSSHQLDPCGMAGCGGETLVAGEERGVERFRERHVHRIMGRQVVPQFPHARQQKATTITCGRVQREPPRPT